MAGLEQGNWQQPVPAQQHGHEAYYRRLGII